MSTELLVFVVTSVVLIATPGQDMVLVMSRSIAHGARAGVVTAAGVSTGLLGHTILAGLGLGAILNASELVFVAIKLAGAAYLIVIGVRAFRAPPIVLDAPNAAVGSLRGLFVQGAVSNLANPKIAIFYFAFLPQFVARDAAHPTLTPLALGGGFALLTFLVKGPVGYGAGRLSGWLRARPDAQRWMNRVSGSVLVALGVRLAFQERA